MSLNINKVERKNTFFVRFLIYLMRRSITLQEEPVMWVLLRKIELKDDRFSFWQVSPTLHQINLVIRIV